MLKQHPVRTVLLVLAGLVLFAGYYRPALSIYFSQDDIPLLVSVHPGWVTPSRAFFLMGSPVGYRPLTQRFYFYFNQLLFGDDARLHHLMNLWVHLACALLVGWLAGRWFSPDTAWIAAVLFALHPVHFHTTFWISGISQSGHTFFLLSTLVLVSCFLRSHRMGWLMVAVLASAAAFLSKEDAVALPLIVLVVPWLEEGRWKPGLSLPFWLVGLFYGLLRFKIAGFGLPSSGVYDVGFVAGRVPVKTWHYLQMISLGSWLWLPLVALLVWAVLGGWRDSDRFRTTALSRKLTALLLMALASLIPSYFVDSTAPHYLSFSAACLAWATAALLECLRERRRWAAALFLLACFLPPAWIERNQSLASRSLEVPVPRKAELCREWVRALRENPPPIRTSDCRLLFRNFPLRDWETGWFAFMPSLAWAVSVPPDFVFFSEAEAAGTSSPCLYDWRFEGETLRYAGMRKYRAP